MPTKNVRNFWVELSVDDKAAKVEVGPKGETGGFSMLIRQRDEGEAMTAAFISGNATPDGDLSLTIRINNGDGKLAIVGDFQTQR